MTYCTSDWTEDDLPIRPITSEEYWKDSSDISKIKDLVSGLEMNVLIPLDSLKVLGTGKLHTYTCSSFGNYSYYKDENFIYMMFIGSCFKIRYDQKEKVADKLIQLAEGLKKL